MKEQNRFGALENEDLQTSCLAETEQETSTYSAAVQRSKNSAILKNREDQPRKRRGKPTTYILGDSMVKDVKGFKVAKATGNEENVYVKSYSGANVDDMKSHVVPALKRASQKTILHCGTKDLASKPNPTEIANNIVELAAHMKDEENEIFVSGLVHRNDELNDKAVEINKFLSKKCRIQNIPFIDNSNIDERCNLNGIGMHLNYGGTCMLANNFLNCIGFWLDYDSVCSEICEADKDDISADKMPSPTSESPIVPSPYILSEDPPHNFDDAFDDGIRERSSNLEDNDDWNGNSELKTLRLKM